MARIKIFDTTMRDGEQAPGFSMNIDEKLMLAHQLAKLKVDVIEAGFPISSEGDFNAVNAIAKQIKGPVICGLARMLESDIITAAKAIKPAKRGRIHVFVSTSDIHIKYQMRKTRKDVIQMTRKGVRLAKSFMKDIEFSAMDASRTDRDFLNEVFAEAIDAGATTINIPDTVGYSVPSEFGEMIQGIMNGVPNKGKTIFSVHCHNDLGVAVANALTAIQHGVRQVECAVNGIGERAGNTSLEEVVMAIKTRQDIFGHTTGIKTEELYATSRLLTSISGIDVQPNKAIVGRNAFAHESGIHQDGVFKKRETYEIMTAKSVGIPSTTMVLGKHSGRHAFRKKIEGMGFKTSDAQLNTAFDSFKALADRKKEVFDEDIEALLGEGISSAAQEYELDYFQITTGNSTMPTATVRLLHNEKQGRKTTQTIKIGTATGDGPIDALYLAIEAVTGIKSVLRHYIVKAATPYKDAMAEVTVLVAFGKQSSEQRGRAASVDTVEASAKAYLSAFNRYRASANGAAKKAAVGKKKAKGHKK